MSRLAIKRASLSRLSGEWNDDDYDVLADGAVVEAPAEKTLPKPEPHRDTLDPWWRAILARSEPCCAREPVDPHFHFLPNASFSAAATR